MSEQMSGGLPPEVLPSVSCDIALGKLVTNIEVDAEYFASVMAEHGLGEAAIAETNIVMSADTITKRGKTRAKSDELVTHGTYDPTTRTVQVNIGSLTSDLDYYRETRSNDPIVNDVYDTLGSLDASRYALHEIGHRITVNGNEWLEKEIKFFELLIPERLLGRIVRSLLRVGDNPTRLSLADTLRRLEVLKGMKEPKYEHYKNSPSEMMADAVKDRADVKWPAEYTPIRISLR